MIKQFYSTINLLSRQPVEQILERARECIHVWVRPLHMSVVSGVSAERLADSEPAAAGMRRHKQKKSVERPDWKQQ